MLLSILFTKILTIIVKTNYFKVFSNKYLAFQFFVLSLHPQSAHTKLLLIKAQMAESVDALVSNTSGAIRAGSTPALGTESGKVSKLSSIFFISSQLIGFPKDKVKYLVVGIGSIIFSVKFYFFRKHRTK